MNLYIFNPEAKNANRLRNKVKSYLAHLNLEGEFVEAKRKEDVAVIAQEALNRKIDTIVAIGGDGIVNRVIQVIAGENINMGVIPIGETNFLASFLGINNWRKGCEALVKEEFLNLNLGVINQDKYFISSVELESKERPPQSLWNKILHKKQIQEYIPTSITIKNNGVELKAQAEVSSIIVSTIPFPVPEDMSLKEIMQKGELNIIIKSRPKEGIKKNDEITSFSGKKVEILSKKKMSIKTDGEKYGKTDISIEIIPGALKVILPKEKTQKKSQS